MAIRALMSYNSSDLPSNWNDRFKNLFTPGIYSGGEVTAVPGKLEIAIGPFVMVTGEGMVVREDDLLASQRLAIAPSTDQMVGLRAKYSSYQPPTLEWLVVQTSSVGLIPDAASVLWFARVQSDTQQTTQANITKYTPHRMDLFGRSVLRPAVQSYSYLPGNPNNPSDTNVADGDIAFAINAETLGGVDYYGNTFYRYTAGSGWGSVGDATVLARFLIEHDTDGHHGVITHGGPTGLPAGTVSDVFNISGLVSKARTYVAVGGSNLVIAINCAFSGSNWVRDDNTKDASAIFFEPGGVRVMTKLASSVTTWSNSFGVNPIEWDKQANINNTTSSIDFANLDATFKSITVTNSAAIGLSNANNSTQTPQVWTNLIKPLADGTSLEFDGRSNQAAGGFADFTFYSNRVAARDNQLAFILGYGVTQKTPLLTVSNQAVMASRVLNLADGTFGDPAINVTKGGLTASLDYAKLAKLVGSAGVVDASTLHIHSAVNLTATTGTNHAVGANVQAQLTALDGHGHPQSEITGLTTSLGLKADVTYVNTQIATRAPTAHTHAESEITGLVADLASKASTGSVVTLSGDQTVGGVKTFSLAPKITAMPSPITVAGYGDEATKRSYVRTAVYSPQVIPVAPAGQVLTSWDGWRNWNYNQIEMSNNEGAGGITLVHRIGTQPNNPSNLRSLALSQMDPWTIPYNLPFGKTGVPCRFRLNVRAYANDAITAAIIYVNGNFILPTPRANYVTETDQYALFGDSGHNSHKGEQAREFYNLYGGYNGSGTVTQADAEARVSMVLSRGDGNGQYRLISYDWDAPPESTNTIYVAIWGVAYNYTGSGGGNSGGSISLCAYDPSDLSPADYQFATPVAY